MTHSPDHAERARAKIIRELRAKAKRVASAYQDTLEWRAADMLEAASLRGRDAVVEAASLALMYLQTGVMECEQCGHDIKTSDLDAAYALAEVVEPWDEDRAALHDAAHLQQNGEGVGNG